MTREICPTCEREGDEIECDADGCSEIAATYCDGCECWRCAKHECECGSP